eukprot:5309849-Prymnesium_polylepis.1
MKPIKLGSHHDQSFVWRSHPIKGQSCPLPTEASRYATTLEQLLQDPNAHGDVINSVDFSPDGTRVVTGSEDGLVRIWGALLRASHCCGW